MRTVILDAPGRLRLADNKEPSEPLARSALVRVHCVGVCGTDLHAYRGRQPYFSYPRILGHELGVEVLEAPANDRCIAPGVRCAVEPYLNCGCCIACRSGKTNCCARLRVLGVHMDGGMCERLVVPLEKLHPSNTLTFEQLALVETLGIGHHAVGRGRPEPGEWVCVVGAGPIGLSVVQFAALSGARVVVIDVNPDRLAFCAGVFGVEHLIAADDDTQAALERLTGGDMPTLVMDATGNPKSMERSLDFAANGGRVVFVGLVQSDITFSDPEFHRKELTLFATRNSTTADFRSVLDHMEAGTVVTDPWITHRSTSETIIDDFPTWLGPGSKTVKAVVSFP